MFILTSFKRDVKNTMQFFQILPIPFIYKTKFVVSVKKFTLKFMSIFKGPLNLLLDLPNSCTVSEDLNPRYTYTYYQIKTNKQKKHLS